MSTKGKANVGEYDPTTLEDEDLPTHQEAIPVPCLSGTRLVALRWISPALNMVAEQAPDERPGKK